jgi:hypothetical protein
MSHCIYAVVTHTKVDVAIEGQALTHNILAVSFSDSEENMLEQNVAG